MEETKLYVDTITGSFGLIRDLVQIEVSNESDVNEFLRIAAKNSDVLIEWAKKHGKPMPLP